MKFYPNPYRITRDPSLPEWKRAAPNGWRHERTVTHRKPSSSDWSWRPPKKPRVTRAELERNRQRDLAKLEAAWSGLTGEAQ